MNNEEVVNVTDAANRVVEGVISLKLSKGERAIIAAGNITLIAVSCVTGAAAVCLLAKHIVELKEAKRKAKKSQKKQID